MSTKLPPCRFCADPKNKGKMHDCTAYQFDDLNKQAAAQKQHDEDAALAKRLIPHLFNNEDFRQQIAAIVRKEGS